MIQRKVVSSVFGAALFGFRSAVFIWGHGERLVPDTAWYSRGGAWWSSLLGSGFSFGFGITYLRVLGTLGALLFGAALGYFSRGRSWPALVVAVFLLPPGLYTIQASVDALGAAIVLVAINSKQEKVTLAFLVVAFAVHLVAGLCIGVALATRFFGLRCDAVAVFVGGIAACVAMWHVQSRYLLPGTALICIIVVPLGLRWLSSQLRSFVSFLGMV